MNAIIWEALFSAVVLLELPAVVSAAILFLRARKSDPPPTRRQLGMGIGIGLTIPWAGGLIGLVLSVLLALVASYTGGPSGRVMPVLLSTVLSVLALQYWWTRLVLAAWTVPPSNSDAKKEESPEEPAGTSP